jgi:hypothetical protein
MDDLDDLDPSIAEEILSPYPELWQQWKANVYRPDVLKHLGSGGLKRYHSPVFLRELVRQHRWLTDGPGDQPDPALEARCEAIAATWPGYAERRRQDLNDPWWRAAPFGSRRIAEEYDPEHLERMIAGWRESADPYSEKSIKWREMKAMLRAGATLSLVDSETGEELSRTTPQDTAGPEGSAGYN